jgi:hypothetical protein
MSGIKTAYQPWLSTWYRTATQPPAQWMVPIPDAAAPVDAGGPAGNYYRVNPVQMSRILNSGSVSGMGCVGCMGTEGAAGGFSWWKLLLAAGLTVGALKLIFG